MINVFTPFFNNRVVAVLALILCLYSCSSAQIDFNQELIRVKEEAKTTLSKNVLEFNHYKDRPKSDGPFNKENNTAFLQENIPLFVSSDNEFTKVYNYRWWMISKHLKTYHDEYDAKDYWVVTEFFGVKPWASLSGAITCPAGHQFYDVRWLRDPKYLQSYAEYYMKGSASKLNQRENKNFLTYLSRPESHHYSSWMIDGVDAFLKIHPDNTWLQTMLPHMENHQKVWDDLFTVKHPNSKTNGMYKILDVYDGMEFTISAAMALIASNGAYKQINEASWKNYYIGWGTTNKLAKTPDTKLFPKAYRNGYPVMHLVRPTMNSYAYGNFKSLSNLYALQANSTPNDEYLEKSKHYQSKADAIENKIFSTLWNADDLFFNTYTAGDNAFGVKDFESRVRESVGYTPWYFNMPKLSKGNYSEAWKMFASNKGFLNNKGMTTAEIQHPYYNEHAYAWNGRGWPFQNSVVYKAYANYLKNYKASIEASDKDLFYNYLTKLVHMHGEEKNIGEWYIPSNGKTFGGVKDYFHSTFPDIIIEDLIGFTASHTNSFSLQPILPEHAWDSFYLGNINYHGYDIDIIWKKDWDENEAGNQSFLCVWVDNKLVASNKSLSEKINITLP